MTQRRLERGDVLFHEGDQGDRLYVIGEGKIKLGRRSSDGRENLVAILGPGEMFGELSLFDPGPRTMTATAVAETQLIGDRPRRPQAACSTGRPEVAKALLAALAQRLRRTNENLADLVFTDVPGRVAKALLDLSSRFGRPVEDGRPRRPRPHPGGARPARRRLPRDGQQGAGRLRQRAAGCASRPARCCSWTSSASSAAPADLPEVLELARPRRAAPPATPRGAPRRRPARTTSSTGPAGSPSASACRTWSSRSRGAAR